MRKIISFIFITWFISCSGNRDIVLTDFTKELISIYLNDSEHIQAQKRKDEIILISTTDSLYYTLLIFSNNSKSYKYETFDFVGRTIYMGHSIKAFGDKIPIFYSGNNFVKQKRQDIPNMKEYDPSVWQVSFVCSHFTKRAVFIKTNLPDRWIIFLHIWDILPFLFNKIIP